MTMSIFRHSTAWHGGRFDRACFADLRKLRVHGAHRVVTGWRVGYILLFRFVCIHSGQVHKPLYRVLRFTVDGHYPGGLFHPTQENFGKPLT